MFDKIPPKHFKLVRSKKLEHHPLAFLQEEFLSVKLFVKFISLDSGKIASIDENDYLSGR